MKLIIAAIVLVFSMNVVAECEDFGQNLMIAMANGHAHGLSKEEMQMIILKGDTPTHIKRNLMISFEGLYAAVKKADLDIAGVRGFEEQLCGSN